MDIPIGPARRPGWRRADRAAAVRLGARSRQRSSPVCARGRPGPRPSHAEREPAGSAADLAGGGFERRQAWGLRRKVLDGLTLGRYATRRAELVEVGVVALTSAAASAASRLRVRPWTGWCRPAAVTADLSRSASSSVRCSRRMIADLPRLVPRPLRSAIGILVAVSGGRWRFFPWVIGAAMQPAGAWACPYQLLSAAASRSVVIW